MSEKQKQCNCITEMEQATLKFLQQKFKGTGKIEQKDGMDVAFGMSGTKTYTTYSYKNTTVKKDGSLGATFNREQMLIHTFCPFCGEKYPTKDDMKPIELPNDEGSVATEAE